MSKNDYLRAIDRQRPSVSATGIVIAGGGGGGGDAQTLQGYGALDFLSPTYLTLSADPNLRNERVLTPGSGLLGTDGGANAAYTLAVRLKAPSGLEADSAGLALADSVAGAGLGIAGKVMAVNTGTGVRIVGDAVAIDAHTHQIADQGGQISHGLALTGLGADDHTQYVLRSPATTARNVVQSTAVDATPLTLQQRTGQTAPLWRVTGSGGTPMIQITAIGDMQSGNFVGGIVDGAGWQLSQAGRFECSSAFIRGTLYAATFAYKEINALNGFFYVTNASPLKRALTAVAGDDIIHVEGPVFATGSWLVMQTLSSLAGDYIVKREWMKVIADGINGSWDATTRAYRYKVTRNVFTGDGGVLSTWGEGNAVVELGRTATGGWVTMVGGSTDAEGPYIGVTRRTADTALGFSQNVRLGNLRGVLGIGTDVPGLALGDLTAGSRNYLRADASVFVLHGIRQFWYDGAGNQRGEVNPLATGSDHLFWLGLSSADRRLAVRADGTVFIGNVPSQNVAGWAHPSDLTQIDGGDIRAGTLLLTGLDPAGEFAGQNLLMNSSFVEDSNNDGFADNWGFRVGFSGTALFGSINSDVAVYDGMSQLLDFWRADPANASYLEAFQTVVFPSLSLFPPGRRFCISLWVFRSAAEHPNTTTGLYLRALTSGGAFIGDFAADERTLTMGTWTRMTCNGVAPANTGQVQLLLRHFVFTDGGRGRIWIDGGTLNLGQYPIAWSAAQRGSVFIDGSKIRVGTRNAARIEINAAEVAGYSDLTTRQFYLRATDGRAMFGGGRGVLDASGMVLSGNETSFNTFNAVRWMTVADPPGGTEIARVAAGRFADTHPEVQIFCNPNPAAGSRGEIFLESSARTTSGFGSTNVRSWVRATADTGPSARLIQGVSVAPGSGFANIELVATGTDSMVTLRTQWGWLRMLHSGALHFLNADQPIRAPYTIPFFPNAGDAVFSTSSTVWVNVGRFVQDGIATLDRGRPAAPPGHVWRYYLRLCWSDNCGTGENTAIRIVRTSDGAAIMAGVGLPARFANAAFWNNTLLGPFTWTDHSHWNVQVSVSHGHRTMWVYNIDFIAELDSA